LTRFFNTIFFLLLPLLITKGQTIERERFFQVTGIITDEESRALSNVGVISLKLKRGTISEKTGIYSITSTPGDTILFRALGFKRKLVKIPQSFDGRHFYTDIVMSYDTIPIEDVVILPWKSYNEFIKDMTKPIPIEPEIANMNNNLASIYAGVANTTGVKITPEAGYKYAMEQNFNAMATKNQYPVNNLLNPFAWAKFITGVKNGLFKNQHFNKPVKAKAVKMKKKKSAGDK
jgi:hypothetical protein